MEMQEWALGMQSNYHADIVRRKVCKRSEPRVDLRDGNSSVAGRKEEAGREREVSRRNSVDCNSRRECQKTNDDSRSCKL